MNCALSESFLTRILEHDGSIHMQLGKLQKDLRLSLNLAEEYSQACPITAITNEVFKHTKNAGFMDHDISSVYVRTKNNY